MPIALVAPGDPIPVPTEEPIIKRGRGRPPGSKNKNKIAEPIESNEEHAPPAEEALPVEEEPPVEPASESIEEEPDEPPPPPKPRERKPRPPPSPPPPRERKPRKPPPQRPETPPETPRTAKSRLWRAYREAQASAQTQRRDHFCGILDRFMR